MINIIFFFPGGGGKMKNIHPFVLQKKYKKKSNQIKDPRVLLQELPLNWSLNEIRCEQKYANLVVSVRSKATKNTEFSPAIQAYLAQWFINNLLS